MTTNSAANSPIQIKPEVSIHPMSNEVIRPENLRNTPLVLLILDGWGIGPQNQGNAIHLAKTPNMDRYWQSFPHTQLEASGEAVGLPHRVDGNSETGHINIGAGKIVYQYLPRINAAIADGSFEKNPAFHQAIDHTKQHNSILHLMGLIGAGNVHSNIEHLFALLAICKQAGLTKVYIHGFTDGRDSPPTSGVNYIRQVQEHCEKLGIGKIATLMGRYYAMDRDRRWERVEKAYNTLTIGSGVCIKDPIGAMQQQYNQGVTDEFINPMNICNGDGSTRLIEDNDAVIFFNYRVDRPRELSRAFVMPDFEKGIKKEDYDPYYEKYYKTHLQKTRSKETFSRQKIIQNLKFVTMTRYSSSLPSEAAFDRKVVEHPLGEALAQSGLRQLRITEAEKERMVTYYLNGQRQEAYPGEDWIIFPSKGARSYDQIPEMSTREIGDEVIKQLQQDKYDAIMINIASPDMVGHSGNLEAGIKACEIVDEVTGKIVEAVLAKNGAIIITADHGNIEEMINNDTNQVDTEHSSYPVPCIFVGQQFAQRSNQLPPGILADLAPTMLKLLNIPQPKNMTGRALI